MQDRSPILASPVKQADALNDTVTEHSHEICINIKEIKPDSPKMAIPLIDLTDDESETESPKPIFEVITKS